MKNVTRIFSSVGRAIWVAMAFLLVSFGVSYAQPTFSNAVTVNSTTIDIQFSETITAVNAFGDFSIDAGAVVITAASFSGTDDIVTLTVDPISSNFFSTDLDIAAGAVTSVSGVNVPIDDRVIDDGIEPGYTVSPNVSNIASTSLDLNVTIDESGSWYFVVVADGTTAPLDNSEVDGLTPVSGTNTSGTETGTSVSISGLSSNTEYDIYVYATDDEGNENTFQKVDVFTNAIPVLAGIDAGDDLSYLAGDGEVDFLSGDEIITDADNPASITGASLTVSFSAGGENAQDILSILDEDSDLAGNVDLDGANVEVGGVVVATYSGGSAGADLVINFTAGTVSDAQAILRLITYENSSGSPVESTRTVSFVYNDGYIGSAILTVDITVTTATIDTDSSISGAGNEQISKIDYTAFDGAVGALDNNSTINVVQVYSFTITDAGSGDGLGTIIDDVDLTVASSAAITQIRAIGLYNGTTLLAETGTINATNTMDISSLTVADGSSVTVDVWVSFNTSVTDNNQFTFGVSAFTQSGSTSTVSGFSTITSATTTADYNAIYVIATQLAYSANDPASDQFERNTENLGFTIQAQDNNDNLDEDEFSVLNISGLSGLNTSSISLVSGQATPTITISDEVENGTLTITDDDAGAGNADGNTLTLVSSTDVDIYDTTAPMSSTIVPGISALGVGLLDDLTIQFSEEVVGVSTKTIAIYSTSPSFHSISIDADDTDYVNSDATGLVTISLPESLKPSRTYIVTIENGAFSDAPNNTNTVDAGPLSYSSIYTDDTWQFDSDIDNVAPIAVITRQSTVTGDINGTSDTSVTFNIDWNEEINDATFTAADIALGTTNITTNPGTLTNLGDDMTYTFEVDGITLVDPDLGGILNITVGPNVDDIASPTANSMSAASGPSDDFLFDLRAPEITTLSVASDGVDNKFATTGNTITLDLTFSEDLASAPLVSVRTGGALVNNSVSVSISGAADEWEASYTVSALDTDGTLEYTLDFEDIAGNIASLTDELDYSSGATTASSELTVDKLAPSVNSIVRTASADEYSNANSVSFTVTFNEDVTGVDADGSDFDLSGVTGTIFSVTASSSTEYVVLITTITGQGELNLDFVGSPSITDNAGNSFDGTTISSEETYTIDTSAPIIDASTETEGLEVTLTSELNEAGILYWAIYADGTAAPTESALQLGTGAIDFGFVTHSIALNELVVEINLAALNTDYDLYLVAEDDLGNLGNVQPVINLLTGGVNITAATATNDFCIDGAVQVLSDIIISEGIASDFRIGSGVTLRLELPTGFEFNESASGDGVSTTGTDLSALTFSYPSPNTIEIIYTVSGQVTMDQITVTGLEVLADGSPSAGVTIMRTGGTADIFNAAESDNRIFATLTSVTGYNAPAFSSSAPGNLVENNTDVANVGGDQDGVIVFLTGSVSNAVVPFVSQSLALGDIVNVYSDESLVGTPISYTSVVANDSYSPTMQDLGLSTGSLGFNNFYVTVTADADGCESDATRVSIVIIAAVNSAGTTTFSEENTVGTVLTVSQPTDHSGSFSGAGLTNVSYGDPNASVRFVPNTAGVDAGSFQEHTIEYTLSKDGIDAVLNIVLRVNAFQAVLTDADISYCSDEATLDWSDGTGVDINFPSLGAGEVFHDIQVYVVDSDGIRTSSDISTRAISPLMTKPTIVNTGFGGTPTTGWSFTPSNAHIDDEDTLSLVLTIRRTSDDATSEFVNQELIIYSINSLEIDNDTDADAFDTYYCEDTDPFNIRVSMTSDIIDLDKVVIPNGYTLYQQGPDLTFGTLDDVLIVSSSTSIFDPSNPDQDLDSDEDETGLYRISYTTTFISPASCSQTVIADIEILAKPSTPVLTAGSLFDSDLVSPNVAGSAVDPISTDDYFLEYSAGNDVIPTLTADGGDGGVYNWYGDISLSTLLVDPGPSTTILGSGTGGIIQNTNASQIDDVYFTSTTDIDINSSGFVGCESDARGIVLQVYDLPNEPSLEVYADDKFVGSDTYIFEYCATSGGTVDLDDIQLKDTYDAAQPTESYFTVLNSALSPIATLSDIEPDNDPNDFIYDPGALNGGTDGNSDTLYIVQTDYDNSFGSESFPFLGSSSDTTTVIFKVNINPEAPEISAFQEIGDDNTYKFCYGATLDNIETPNLSGYDYVWFNEDLSSQIVTAVSDGGVAADDELGYDEFDPSAGTKIDTTYHVVNYTNANDDTNFEGCPSSATAVPITVYPQPEAPFNSAENTGGSTGTDVYEYCQYIDITSEVLSITNFATSIDGTTQYKWYSTDPDGAGSFIPFLETENTSVELEEIENRTDVDISDPNISGSAITTIYLTQETDELCESQSLPIDITVNAIPTVEIVDRNQGSGNLTTEFCYDESTTPEYSAIVTSAAPFSSSQWSVSGINIANDGTALDSEFDMATWYNSRYTETTVGETGNGDVEGGTPQVFELTFAYTDTNGCTNLIGVGEGTEEITVNPLPAITLTSNEVGFEDDNFALCESSNSFVVEAVAGEGISGNTGEYYVNGILIEKEQGSIYKATFDPLFWGEGQSNTDVNATGEDIRARSSGGISADYTIRYDFSDDRGCAKTVQEVVTLYDRPVMEFEINGGCVNPNVEYFGGIDSDESGYDEGDSNLSYLWTWVSQTTGNEEDLYAGESNTIQNPAKQFEIEPLVSDIYDVTLMGTYTFITPSTNNSCSSVPLEQPSNVTVSPTVSFTWSPPVVGLDTDFRPYELVLENSVVTDVGIKFGATESVSWYEVDGDGAVLPSISSDDGGEFGTIEHVFTDADKYDVTMILSTADGCTDSLTRSVNVLPIVSVTDQYLADFGGDFNPDTDGWYAESLIDDANQYGIDDVDPDPDVEVLVDTGLREHSWVWGEFDFSTLTVVTSTGSKSPEVNDKPTNSANNYMWATLGTSDDNNYLQGEDSWIYTPVFDISGLDKPMLSMNILYDFENSKDGTIIQYSTDTLGQEWHVLGYTEETDPETLELLAEGLDWYDSDNVGADPGQQQVLDNTLSTSLGWSGRYPADQETWKSARHGLDTIPVTDRGFVRFRIAIAATDDGDNPKGNFGFAFDDFIIRSRDKNVLIEEFYVLSDDEVDSLINDKTIDIDNAIEKIVGDDESQIIIAYHANFDDAITDPFNVVNTADPAARKSWYNLETVTSVLDGQVASLDDGEDGLTWTARDLRLNSLDDPGFNIVVEADISAANNEIKGTVSFQINDISGISAGTELIAYVAIIEKHIELEVGKVSSHTNVLRKLLPDASGQFLKLGRDYDYEEFIPLGLGTDADGDEMTLDVQWDISNIVSAEELAAIVFIQNRKTKEIYQAIQIDATTANSIVSSKSDAFEDILNLEELVTDTSFKMYPNPSDGSVTIKFNTDMKESVDWTLYDQTGRVFDYGHLDAGMNLFEIETNDFPNGMYYIQIRGDQFKMSHEKLVIFHK